MAACSRIVAPILLFGVLVGCQGKQQLHPLTPGESLPNDITGNAPATLPSPPTTLPTTPPATANFEGAIDHTWPGGTGAVVGARRTEGNPYRGFVGTNTSTHDNGEGVTVTTAFDFVLLDSNDTRDTYRVTRRLQNGEEEQRTFHYSGQPVTLFEDEYCKTVIRPFTPLGF